jgi:hypothetical protein
MPLKEKTESFVEIARNINGKGPILLHNRVFTVNVRRYYFGKDFAATSESVSMGGKLDSGKIQSRMQGRVNLCQYICICR